MSTSSLKTANSTFRVERRAMSQGDDGQRQSRPLADWRTADAYVLLGDPGAGKSFSFEAEATACGGILIPARDVVASIASTDVGNRTVFIDGLDEVRAGTSNGNVPFDAIRSWLKRAGSPRFRLSCREADWLGQSDKQALERDAPGTRVAVLHLEPLDREDILAVLRHRPAEVPDPEAFWRQAEQFNLTELFGNPLLLDLTVKAVAAGGSPWQSTRKGIYEAACRQLATETSIERLAVGRPRPGDIDRMLDDAGLLCAVLLLSNMQSWAIQATNLVESVDISALPPDLRFHDAKAALASKVFTTVAGRSTPRHRSIAEYLAARALSKRVSEGLPLTRLLALILGCDGRPVDPMRGLFAWLVVHHLPARARLMKLDPLGVVLNGDVAALSTPERLQLLEALGNQAQQDPWFRSQSWVSHPFGPLATADMEADYEKLLLNPRRDKPHQAFMDCVLDALRHGHPMPMLATALEAWVEDSDACLGNRIAAYQAWKHNCGLRPATVLGWLNQLFLGVLADDHDRLLSYMLTDLYPNHLRPSQVLQFMRPIHRWHDHVDFAGFWRQALIRQSRPLDFAELADAWVDASPQFLLASQHYQMRPLTGEVLAGALVHGGDKATNDRLYAWMGLCIDEHGFSQLKDEPRREVAQWLESRPDRIKALALLGYQGIKPDAQGQRFFWPAEERLHGAKKTTDWFLWLLDQAAMTQDGDLARYWFQSVASECVESPAGFDIPTAEKVERWVADHLTQWPQARQWLADVWTCCLEDWRGEQHRKNLKYKAEQNQAREDRKRALQPYLAELACGSAPARILHQLALAHENRFTNINGETALERVQDFLVSDQVSAAAAVAAFKCVLSRKDIPSVDEILDIEAKGKYHLIRPAALLAASLSLNAAPDAILDWSDDLTQKLIAFYLTDGTGNMPVWYPRLVAERPHLVAPIFMRYALPKLKSKLSIAITGLWALAGEASHRELARLVLPKLLEKFPLRASETSRKELNRSLLASLHVLKDVQAASIVQLKLAKPGLDAAQRVCWLVADLPYSVGAAERLASWVGNNERRAVTLGIAMHEQGSLGHAAHRLEPAAVGRLIEVLAPITPREIGSRSGFVSVANEREETVSGLLNVLASNPVVAARDALHALNESDLLGAWKEVVDYNVRTQQSTAREALFKPVDPVAAALVIANLAPANAADLQALLVQHLRDIEADLRGADTYLVRQFWRERLEKEEAMRVPQDENYCRDLLLEKLKTRLANFGVNLVPERIHAAEKRADLCAEFIHAGLRIAVPIEVKKEDHRTLWTGWQDQLQGLYTIDPATGGYGLYLVLWFGHKPRPTPEGEKPRDARHMQELLVKRIPQRERSRITVQVIDLSLQAAA